MKSSKCLFSPTVFKSDIKRFLPFAVPLLIAEIILFPVVIYSNYDLKSHSQLTLEEFVGLSSVSSCFAFFFAAVAALLVFSYLYSPHQCNALHAFPVGRKALFTTHFISGYLLLTVPQVLGFAAALPVMSRVGRNVMAMLLMQAVSVIGESFIYFAIAVLAVMLAGNIFAGAVIYLIINFLYTALTLLLNSAVYGFGYGITGNELVLPFGGYLSPAVQLISRKGSESWVEAGVVNNAAVGSVKAYYLAVLVLVLAAAVIAVLAFLLYKARALECAGDMVAYKAEIPVLSVICAVVGGGAFALFLSAMLDFDTVGSGILYAVFSLIFYFAAQMVLKKSAKVFQPRHFVVWFLTMALTLGLAFGLAQLETNYVPKASAVKSVVVNGSYDMELTAPEEIEKAQRLHRRLIDTRTMRVDVQDKIDAAGLPVDEAEETWYNIGVTYRLKSNRIITRTYTVIRSEEILAQLDALEAAHQPVTVFEQLEKTDFVIKSCTVTDYRTGEESLLRTDELAPVWALCAEDAKAMSKDYRTSKGVDLDTREQVVSVSFNCALKSAADRKVLEDICRSTQDVTDSTIYMDDLSDGDGFNVELYTFRTDAKTLAYLNNRQ